MARPIKMVTASAEVRAELERRAKASTSAHRDRFRAQIILLRLDGLKNADVAERMCTSMPTVSTWSSRFERLGLDGLKDKTGRGRKPSIPAKKIERVVTEATRPPKPARAGACAHEPPRRHLGQFGAAHLVAERAQAAHRQDLQAVERSEVRGEVLGRDRALSRSADHALVLCCDEKSQCQALERTQLGLPLAPKRPRTMTHDYIRHGTITLFAALSELTGKLITRTEASHTHVEWLRFLKQIDRETPTRARSASDRRQLRHPQASQGTAWLARHPRFTMHFTPTSSSWLNLVERFFADLTADVIRAGSFASVNELVATSTPISPSATPIQSPTSGRPKASHPRQNQTRPRHPRQDEGRMSY